MAKLIFKGEPFAGRIYDLTLEKTTVGRGDQNTLALHDASVSLTHCEILVHGREVIVRDLGSANGTYVNGLRLDHQQCQIKSDQTVRFGSVEAQLDLGVPNDEDTASEETAVFAMRRAMRDQRRAEKNPKPASAAATFDAGGAVSAQTDHTVILPRPPSPVKVVGPEAPPVPGISSPCLSRRILICILGLVLFVALVIWLMGKRK